MKKLLIFLIIFVRLYVMIKVLFLLYKTSIDPTYPVEDLTWWIYYLVFDMWLVSNFKVPAEIEEE